ncbi:MAG: pseudouridine synthase [Pseudomonadota bacterium]
MTKARNKTRRTPPKKTPRQRRGDQDPEISESESQGERLQKALAAAGWGSRREIERQISAGQIMVNDVKAVLGVRVQPGDRIETHDGRRLTVREREQAHRLIALNKPVGMVCTRKDTEGRKTVFDVLPRLNTGRWISVGRLDINTSGLLLFTTDGELASRLMHPSYEVDREYAVRVYGEVGNDTVAQLLAGVDIDGEEHRFLDIVAGERKGANGWFYCVLQGGKNREVRRLWESQGLTVSRLMRVRFGNVVLEASMRRGRPAELKGQIASDLYRLVHLNPPK